MDDVTSGRGRTSSYNGGNRIQVGMAIRTPPSATANTPAGRSAHSPPSVDSILRAAQDGQLNPAREGRPYANKTPAPEVPLPDT